MYVGGEFEARRASACSSSYSACRLSASDKRLGDMGEVTEPIVGWGCIVHCSPEAAGDLSGCMGYMGASRDYSALRAPLVDGREATDSAGAGRVLAMAVSN